MPVVTKWQQVRSQMKFHGAVRRKMVILTALLLSVLCFAAPPLAAAQDQGGAAPLASPATASSDADYQLGIADKVRVIVYNEPSLSGEFTVGDNGSLSLPLIGEVVAKGRSQRDVTADIQNRLADGYLKEPKVSLDVLTYRPFYILGEVAKPGEYPYSSNLTVVNAIARAEGFTYRANKGKVFLKRAGETEEKAVKLTPSLQVKPGDTVRVGERYF